MKEDDSYAAENHATFARQMEAGRLYAKLPVFQKRLQFALDGIYAMSELAPCAYASISFGKQSICLAHMLYRIIPDLPMFFLASWESWDIHNFREVIDLFASRFPINLTIVQTDNVTQSENWKESRDKGQRDLQNMTNRDKWQGWYWGLVKEESYGRRRTLSMRWDGQPHPTIFRYKDGKYRCCPLMNWNVNDIAAYVGLHDLPLLEVYKRNGLQHRTTARITRNMAELGGIAFLQHEDIEAMNRIAAKFPELRSFS